MDISPAIRKAYANLKPIPRDRLQPLTVKLHIMKVFTGECNETF